MNSRKQTNVIANTEYRLRKFSIWLINKPEYIFLFLALVFGMLFIFRLPPLSGTDEFTHFPRVYQISEGIFNEQSIGNHQFGGKLPINVNDMINAYRNLSRHSPGQGYLNAAKQLNAQYGQISNPGTTKVTANFTSTIIYPPWAYIPSLIGLSIAKITKLPIIWYVYLARISTYLVWIALAFFAIKYLPAGKYFMLAIALLPTSVSQAATIGADGLQMALAWLLISLTLAVVAKKLKPKLPLLIVMCLLAVYVAVIKDSYFLLGLIPLAIPASRFAKRNVELIFKTSILSLVLVCSILFTLRTVHAVHGIVLTPTIGMYFNSNQQISYIFSHLPLYLFHVIEQPFTKIFDTTYLGIVGILTNRLIYLSILVIGLLYFGLYLGINTTQTIDALREYRVRLLILFSVILVSSYGLLASAFYIGNTSVGAQFVNGFYGRYFLPLLPLLLVYPLTLRRPQKNKQYSLSLSMGIGVISAIGLIAMIMSIQ